MTIRQSKYYFSRTQSGKTWRKVPYATVDQVITDQEYKNFCDSIKYFGGRVEYAYTLYGYVPIRESITSPDNTIKIITKFTFTD